MDRRTTPHHIAVFDSGYVGLVAVACFAELSHVSRVWAVIDYVPSSRSPPSPSAPAPGSAKPSKTPVSPTSPTPPTPEFTAEGRVVEDFMRLDRIVIGTDDPTAARLVEALHDGIPRPVEVMDTASAEMAKMAATARLATKISFTNEIAALCEATDADITHVTRTIGQDHRLSPHFMNPGLGYGGSCFPKDSRASPPTPATPSSC
ncbi:hypothetical protein [Streptomyces sp. NPDC058202]|uniref:hypothetical protein n=1 Tax=Streptomyces sp. NPDC058202 TaxID=3346380 RepID=UPI0036E328E3